MKWIRSLMLLLLLIVVGACQFSPDETEESTKENINIQVPQEKYNTKTSELDLDQKPEEKVVSLGIEGHKEDVKLTKFVNSWVSLWADNSLHIKEINNKIIFSKEDTGLSFSIKRVSADNAEQARKEVVKEMLASGYELIDDFQLDDKDGTGYIYYSYDQRQSVDIYVLKEKNQEVLVQFVIPEDIAETYIYRFEFMVDSIQILL